MSSNLLSKVTVLKNDLKAKKPGLGFWCTFNDPTLLSHILSTGGFNWVLIDAEHGNINDSHYYALSNAAAAAGVSPIIRIPNAEQHLVKRALDLGSHGVMTPMCGSKKDAESIVSWNKYPPRGTRGFGPLFTHHSFGVKDGEYAPTADEILLVIVQIESRDGVNNVEEIAAVDGIDVLFIGPYDLSKFMNVEFGGKEHEEAIQRILDAAHKAGKTAAIFCTSGAQAKSRLDQGFDMVSIITDGGAIASEMQRQLAAATGKVGGETKSSY